MTNSCYTCKHRHSYRETESWEMPHIFWYEHVCDARPTIANLKQFPFTKTDCPKHESFQVESEQTELAGRCAMVCTTTKKRVE